MEVLEENKKLIHLVNSDGDLLDSQNLDLLFPDLDQEIKDIIQQDDAKRVEILSWLKKEIQGSQFNAVRLCCTPNEDTAEITKSFSNDFCESYKICPFYRQGIAPEGDLCPVESLQVSKLTEELTADLQIDIHEDFTDKMTAGEIIIFTILENRAVRGLACLNLGLSDVTFGKNGKEYTRKKNFFLDIIKDMSTLKDKSRRSLVATREEKIKLKQVKEVDKSKNIYSTTMERINKSTPEIGLIIDVNEVEEKEE